MTTWQLLQGDVRETLASLPAASVQTCVTSPPYWGLRDYGHAGQIGLEATPAEYVARMVDVFAGVWRVLKDDGTLWLNLGDSYAGGGYANHKINGPEWFEAATLDKRQGRQQALKKACESQGIKPKDLVGIPWMVAFALRDAGWYLRSDIIWAKPNPMPESVTDRPTKAHEYLFLLTKSARYYYDAAAIAEPVARPDMTHRSAKVSPAQTAAFRGNAPTNIGRCGTDPEAGRNKRTVWTVATQPYPDAHFATYPEDLITPCILAGSRVGDTVLDCFNGSGTTGVVAVRHQRNYIGGELNPAYIELARTRIGNVAPMFAQEVA